MTDAFPQAEEVPGPLAASQEPTPEASLPVPTLLTVLEALPTYAHPGDAGADLTTRVDVVVGPGERVTVPTGVSLALPDGHVAFVVPRSGLAAKRGLTVLNSPGTVDAGYRGEVRVTLLNTDLREAVELRAGDRVAQVVVQRVERVQFVPVPELPTSVRGAGGHGSTGGSDALGSPATPPSETTPSADTTPKERP